MTSGEVYRKFAEQCIDMSERAPPAQSQSLLKMAETWLELAQGTLTSQHINEPKQTAPTSDNLQ
jgi:hypothetical protein